MGKFTILSLSNIRKNIGQFISFAVIVMLAAVMLNIGIIIIKNYGGVYEQKFHKYNCAQVYYTIFDSDWTDDLKSKAAQIEGVKKAETRKCIVLSGSAVYADSGNTLGHIFFDMDEKHSMNLLEPIGSTLDLNSTDNPIYVSYWIYTSGGRIGDKYVFTGSDKTYTFTIAGFVEDMMYGNNNCGNLAIYLPHNDFDKMYNSTDNSVHATTLSLGLYDRDDSKAVFTSLAEMMSGKLTKRFDYCCGYYQTACRNRTVTANITAAILVTFSLIIVAITLLVINFRIKSSMEEEMQNMGVLKANGYTNRQIILSTAFPYLFFAVFFSIVGIVISYLFIPMATGMVKKLSGLNWEQGFDFISAIIDLFVIFIMAALVALLSAGRIRKLHTIEALRSGIKHHNFKKNYFQLEKTGSHLQIALAAKNMYNSLKQNVFLFIVITVMTFGGIYAGSGMYHSVIVPDSFVDAVSEENPSVSITAVTNDDGNEMMKAFKQDNRVKKLFYYDTNSVFIKGESTAVFIIDSYDLLDNDICYRGRNPKHDNELALGTAIAEKQGVGIDDWITVRLGNAEKKYLVVGLIQAPNYNSAACEMTVSGFKGICSTFQPTTLYIYLKDKKASKEFVNDAIAGYGDRIGSYCDFVTMIETGYGTFLPLIAFMICSISIVIFMLTLLVLYMMIKTIIFHRRQELGILKAIGYTTNQLILQTAMSLLPAITLGSLAGGITGHLLINKVWLACFYVMGIRKISLYIPALWTAAIIMAMILFAFMAAVLLSGRIRRVSVTKLVSE